MSGRLFCYIEKQTQTFHDKMLEAGPQIQDMIFTNRYLIAKSELPYKHQRTGGIRNLTSGV
jgi:hypothetical protein